MPAPTRAMMIRTTPMPRTDTGPRRPIPLSTRYPASESTRTPSTEKPGLQRGGERLRLLGDALCPSYHFPETGNLRPGQHQSHHHQTQVKDRPETMAAEDDEEGQNQEEAPQGSTRLRQEGHLCQEHRQGGQDRGYPPQARNPARIPSSPLYPSSTPGARQPHGQPEPDHEQPPQTVGVTNGVFQARTPEEEEGVGAEDQVEHNSAPHRADPHQHHS